MGIYTLDVAKWRCGGAEQQLGSGPTQMANSNGFMCCLGQFALKHTKKHLKVPLTTPHALATELQKAYDPVFVIKAEGKHGFEHTELACDLMSLNDSEYTSVNDKVQSIRELLRQNGHTLRVRNKHFIPKTRY